ncbi:hypothetical protein VTK56DRAFT_911 [Thermocarpiscus australiensis]
MRRIVVGRKRFVCTSQVSTGAKTFQLLRRWGLAGSTTLPSSVRQEPPVRIIVEQTTVLNKGARATLFFSLVLRDSARVPTTKPKPYSSSSDLSCKNINKHHPCSSDMALLAAPRTAPRVSLGQRPDVISTLYPLVDGALQLQQMVGSAAFHLFVRSYFAATIIAATSFLATKSIAWRTFLASRTVAGITLALARRLAWTLWDCKQSRRFRKRLEFELFALLLGPGGNALFLMIFWPGWLMLALLAWGLWHLAG